MNVALLNIDDANIRQLANIFLKTADEHGFVERDENGDPIVNVDQKLLMIVGEVIEAQDELRNGHAIDEIYHHPSGKPEGFVIELADAVIRILDLAAELGLDIQEAIRLKAVYNESRPYKHGKAF